jgi:hypothetical protein
MTRLTSHRNRVFYTQLALVLLLITATVIFIATIGFPLVLNSSLFFNQILNKRSLPQPTQEKENFKGIFSVDSIPTATNSAKIIIDFSVANYDSIAVYLNQEKIEEVPVTSDSFSIQFGDLNKGENKLYFVAKSKKYKKENQSEEFIISFRDEKPKLEISEPADQSKTNKQNINIIGKTNQDSTVKINNLPVVVDYQGGFQASIKLNDGENKIIIRAKDNFGNFEEKTITVTYQKDY